MLNCCTSVRQHVIKIKISGIVRSDVTIHENIKYLLRTIDLGSKSCCIKLQVKEIIGLQINLYTMP